MVDVGQVRQRRVGQVVAVRLGKYGQVAVGEQVEAAAPSAGQCPLPPITSSLWPLNPASLMPPLQTSKSGHATNNDTRDLWH